MIINRFAIIIHKSFHFLDKVWQQFMLYNFSGGVIPVTATFGL